MLNLRGIKARPHDIDEMIKLQPALVELHCSAADLRWTPHRSYDVPLALHVPEYDDGELLDPASEDEQKRLRAQDVYVESVYSALMWKPAFAGKPRLVFHPGGQSPDQRPRGDREALFAALGKTVRAMKAAAGQDVEILIENLPKVCWFNSGSWQARIMTSGSDIAEFCRWMQIGATLDLCHLHLTPHDVQAEIAVMLPHVRHIHYSDGKMREGTRTVYKEGLQIGEGDMPLRAYFDRLMDTVGKSDETIFAVPEIWYGHDNGGAEFVRAWDLIKGQLAAAATP